MRKNIAVALVVLGITDREGGTVGRKLAAKLGYPFYDADDFHGPESIAKMRRGEPLNDADREPWIDRLRTLLTAKVSAGQSLELACSAWRDSHRQCLDMSDCSRRS